MARSTRLVAERKLVGRINVPPSKSYTHRAVIMASLSLGSSKVHNPLESRDTRATFAACRAMGAHLVRESGRTFAIAGCSPQSAPDVVNVENSGTTLRFMTSVFALPKVGYTVLTGDASIRRRPMQGLLDALSSLGANAKSSRDNGCAPIIVGEGGIHGGKATVRSDVSSQFVSSILISAPLAGGDSSIRFSRMVSRPYIEATLHLAHLHGVKIKRENSAFWIQGGQEYRPKDFNVPGDFGSAAFIMSAVALIGGRVMFSGLTESLPQGDFAIVKTLERLGVRVSNHGDSLVVTGDGEDLNGGRFDLSDSPDLLPVLSVLSLKCAKPVKIVGVEHARFKESDRIAASAQGLRMMGAGVEEKKDGLVLRKPKKLLPGILDAHGDHRLFMAFAIASLLAPDRIRVTGAESIDVSYPSFLDDMETLGVKVVKG